MKIIVGRIIDFLMCSCPVTSDDVNSVDNTRVANNMPAAKIKPRLKILIATII
jgi:hypothetical protein